ncbi:hypothetical protein Pcinc_001469 [Petrolisthes cinctipes]|uniref:Uncharacterized protein n=1 Tax=Petrolisthes cinctipes TaxID=88211 RepID=A0AAE1L5Y0_PETCI|nr:hypothetical protein Pcinc_001469 [Petrolisthes cinctipes]
MEVSEDPDTTDFNESLPDTLALPSDENSDSHSLTNCSVNLDVSSRAMADALVEVTKRYGDETTEAAINKFIQRIKAVKSGKRAQYKQAHRKEWETDDKLKAWIAPCHGNSTRAMCKYCKYFSEMQQCIITQYLELIRIEDVSANSLYTAVKEFFETKGIQEEYCIGFASDGVSIKVGKNNSLLKVTP